MKRLFSGILIFSMILTCCCGTSLAADEFGPKASRTLSSYNVQLLKGESKGVITIDYDVQAVRDATTVGVQLIRIYEADGTYVTTISGTPDNGLMASYTFLCLGDYDYQGTSGVSYYAQVIVFARIGDLYDSRSVTTSIVTAP